MNDQRKRQINTEGRAPPEAVIIGGRRAFGNPLFEGTLSGCERILLVQQRRKDTVASHHLSMKTLAVLLLALLVGAATPTRAQDPNAENPVMHSFGAIGAQAVFCNYMAIAELADLHGKQVYDKTKVVQLANMYVGLTTAAKESLTDLVDSGKLNSGDDAAVKEMVIINDLLISTAKGIVTYVETPSPETQAAYEKNRQKSWKAISKFLGIE